MGHALVVAAIAVEQPGRLYSPDPAGHPGHLELLGARVDYVDLFAGAGGTDVAAESLGLRGYGIEYDAAACNTRRAAGLLTVEADVRSCDPLDPAWELVPGFLASPPCQSWSTAGKGAGRAEMDKVLKCIENWQWQGEFSDERTALVLEPLRWILARHSIERPYTWIAMEQVPPCLPIWQGYARLLEDLGYSTAVGILQSECYGVAQTRKRAILMAHKDASIHIPVPTHSRYYPRNPGKLDDGVEPWVSMATALGWSDEFEVESNYGTGGDASNRGVRTGDEPAAAVTSKAGRNKVYLRNGAMKNATVRSEDQPSPTIMAAMDNGDAKWTEGGHHSRRVSVQEAGILQSFAPDYPWSGTKTQQYQQAGNAYPPLMARAVLEACINAWRHP